MNFTKKEIEILKELVIKEKEDVIIKMDCNIIIPDKYHPYFDNLTNIEYKLMGYE